MMGRAPLVDFCNRYTAPRAQLRNRPNFAPPPQRSPAEAASSGRNPKAALPGREWPSQHVRQARFRETHREESALSRILRLNGQPRCHGPGAKWHEATAWLLPRQSLARGALPQPDRLGHLLSRAREIGAGEAHDLGQLNSMPLDELTGRRALSRKASFRAASRDPPRRGARYAAPEVPSIIESCPFFGGLALPPQPVPSLWITEPVPFRSPRRNGH